MASRFSASLGQAARQHLTSGLLRMLAPSVDAAPAEGGLGPHPLGDRSRPCWWTSLPSDDDTLLALAMQAESNPAAASERLAAWLSADEPGQGPSWAALDRIACRLIHMAAIHAWVSLPEDTAHDLAGSARAHGAWLYREQANAADPSDVALAHAALLICGLSWPALAEARGFRGPALSGLRGSVAEAIGEDGAGPSSPTRLARAVWAVALSRAWLDANNASLSRSVEGSLLRASTALWRISGDSGVLPTEPDVAPLLPLGPTPLAHTLQNLMVAWGLQDGPGAAADDPACALLAASVPDGSEPMAGPNWRMWTWRASGVAVAHRLIRKQPAQVWCSAPAQQLQLSLGGIPVLSTEMPKGRLRVARVDGSQATWLYDHGEHTRDIRLRQARLTVTDTGLSVVRWHLPGWTLAPTDKGFQADVPGGGALIIKTEPTWRWALQGQALVGTGEPHRIKYSFELR